MIIEGALNTPLSKNKLFVEEKLSVNVKVFVPCKWKSAVQIVPFDVKLESKVGFILMVVIAEEKIAEPLDTKSPEISTEEIVEELKLNAFGTALKSKLCTVIAVFKLTVDMADNPELASKLTLSKVEEGDVNVAAPPEDNDQWLTSFQLPEPPIQK